MLSSPLTINLGAQAFSLKKKNQDNFGSTWLDKTTVFGTEVKLTIRNSYEGKTPSAASVANGALRTRQYERHIADLEVTVFDEDGYPTVTQSYLHIRHIRGSEVTMGIDVAAGLAEFAEANAAELVDWES